jgi:hypothetical protein
MARQEDTCWRCGARWATEERPATVLRLSVLRVLTPAADDTVGLPGAATLDVDRWANDGGTTADQDRAVIGASAGGRR